MLSSRGRFAAVAGGALGCLLAISFSVAASGPPTSVQVLLCGTTTGFAAYPTSGNSSIDHPTGLQASGSEYAYTNQNCQNHGSSNGTFTWTIARDNVNTVSEHGTEHADAAMTMLSQTTGFPSGFDGGVYEFDLPSGDATTCSGNRSVFYASGHAFDTTCAVGSAPGNFNTEGGAASGQHYNGKYGTLIYQESNNMMSSCPSGGSMYCFQAIIEGQIN